MFRMSTFTVRSGQVSTGARKVYSTGGAKRSSGYHLGKPTDAIEGRKVPSDAFPYKNQRYDEIKSKCLKDGTLFEDPEFPAIESSLFFSGKKPPRPFVWKRPKVRMRLPEMFMLLISVCSYFSQFLNSQYSHTTTTIFSHTILHSLKIWIQF